MAYLFLSFAVFLSLSLVLAHLLPFSFEEYEFLTDFVWKFLQSFAHLLSRPVLL